MEQISKYSKLNTNIKSQRQCYFGGKSVQQRNLNQQAAIQHKSGRRKLLTLFLVNYLILGQAYNTIPFIFAQPYFVCHDETLKSYQCSQKQACLLQRKYQSEQKILQNNNFTAFQVHPKFATPSFITQYKLYCDQKVVGANYQSINFLGHFIACFALVALSGKIIVSKFIYYASITSFAVGISVTVSAFSNIQFLQIMFFIWAFFIQIPNSIIPSAIPYYFEKKKQSQYFAMTHLCFPLYCIINPLSFYLSPDWRSFLVFIVGIPSIILGFLYKGMIGQIKQIKQNVQQQQFQENSQLGVLQILKSKHSVAFLSLVMVSFYPYFNGVSTILALNRIQGDFTFNYLLSTLFQLIFSAIGLICLKYFKSRDLIIFFFALNSILFILSSFLPEQLKTPCLIFGKGFSDALWGVVSTYICQILPRKCMIPVNSVRFCFMLFVSSLIPYFNYLGWLWEIDIFLIMGIIQWTGFYFVYLSQKSRKILLEQQN